MSLVNHLKDIDGQSLFMAVAYGLHMVSGQLTKSLRTGSDPTHVVTVQQMLGRGPWDGCEGLWFRGLEIDPADYEFYPGIQSTGMSDPEQPQDSVFDTDTPHSGFAWLRAELPEGVPDFDTKGSPPIGLAGKFRTMKCFDYNLDGTTKGAAGYTTNPALQVADLICRLGGRPSSRIDWAAWEDWRDFNAEEIDYDYTAIPDFEGIGLWVSLYSGADFDTFVKNRVDPYVEFVSSAGSPDVELPVDNFSVRYEGKIKPKYTQTYTFYITHTHGARVYVDNLTTPLIDQWGTSGTHSATIALTADQLYNIRVDWRHTTGNAEIRLEWESSSQAREVVPHRALYPKTVQRPRYETHPFFPGPTRLDDAVRAVLNLCNATYQEVNGKLRFFSLEQLTATSFRFTNSVIMDGSVQLIPRDPLNLRNSWQARFRDVDSQYLEEPIDPVIIERQDLIEQAGRRIDGQLLELYNTTPHQAWRTLDALVKRSCDRVFDAKLTGLADTYKVLPGDAVSLDIEFLDETARPMLVVEAFDRSSEQTPDEREFLLHDWTGQELEEPDAEAPSVPEIDEFVADSDTELTLSWLASTDNIAVTGYEVRIRETSGSYGAWIDVGNVLNYQFTGLTAGTSYTAQVRAYDAAANISAASSEAEESTNVVAFNVALSSNGSSITVNAESAGAKANLIDGDRDTNASYLQINGTGQWVEISFGASRTIDEINLITQNFSDNTPTLSTDASFFGDLDFDAYYWNGSSWVLIANYSGDTLQWKQLLFSAVTTTAIRFEFNSVGGGALYCREIEAWGF